MGLQTSFSAWSSKLSRSLDRVTNGRSLDSPATYIDGVTRVFRLAQSIGPFYFPSLLSRLAADCWPQTTTSSRSRPRISRTPSSGSRRRSGSSKACAARATSLGRSFASSSCATSASSWTNVRLIFTRTAAKGSTDFGIRSQTSSEEAHGSAANRRHRSLSHYFRPHFIHPTPLTPQQFIVATFSLPRTPSQPALRANGGNGEGTPHVLREITYMPTGTRAELA